MSSPIEALARDINGIDGYLVAQERCMSAARLGDMRAAQMRSIKAQITGLANLDIAGSTLLTDAICDGSWDTAHVEELCECVNARLTRDAHARTGASGKRGMQSCNVAAYLKETFITKLQSTHISTSISSCADFFFDLGISCPEVATKKEMMGILFALNPACENISGPSQNSHFWTFTRDLKQRWKPKGSKGLVFPFTHLESYPPHPDDLPDDHYNHTYHDEPPVGIDVDNLAVLAAAVPARRTHGSLRLQPAMPYASQAIANGPHPMQFDFGGPMARMPHAAQQMQQMFGQAIQAMCQQMCGAGAGGGGQSNDIPLEFTPKPRRPPLPSPKHGSLYGSEHDADVDCSLGFTPPPRVDRTVSYDGMPPPSGSLCEFKPSARGEPSRAVGASEPIDPRLQHGRKEARKPNAIGQPSEAEVGPAVAGHCDAFAPARAAAFPHGGGVISHAASEMTATTLRALELRKQRQLEEKKKKDAELAAIARACGGGVAAPTAKTKRRDEACSAAGGVHPVVTETARKRIHGKSGSSSVSRGAAASKVCKIEGAATAAKRLKMSDVVVPDRPPAPCADVKPLKYNGGVIYTKPDKMLYRVVLSTTGYGGDRIVRWDPSKAAAFKVACDLIDDKRLQEAA